MLVHVRLKNKQKFPHQAILGYALLEVKTFVPTGL